MQLSQFLSVLKEQEAEFDIYKANWANNSVSEDSSYCTQKLYSINPCDSVGLTQIYTTTFIICKCGDICMRYALCFFPLTLTGLRKSQYHLSRPSVSKLVLNCYSIQRISGRHSFFFYLLRIWFSLIRYELFIFSILSKHIDAVLRFIFPLNQSSDLLD